MKLNPVDSKSARHVQGMLFFMVAMFVFGLIGNAAKGQHDQAVSCVIGGCIIASLVLIIEWRISVDGFDKICAKARTLDTERRRALIRMLEGLESDR